MKSLWKPRILVCDDQQRQRDIVADILTGGGYRVSTAESLATALEVFDSAIEGGDPFDLVLTDLKMPNSTEGLDLLRQVKERHERSEVILMTAYATVQTALEAGRFDAYAYLEKPFDRTGLLHVVRRAEEKLRLVLDNERLRQLVNPHDSFHGIVGESVRMRELTELIRRVAVTDATCLVRGESGTGKELVARAIHRSSDRADKPFVAVNCAAIPETLIESELFGHERGAFTGANRARAGRFEETRDGTLFLDEIGSMKFDLQAKLLRALQEREFSRVGGTNLLPFGGRIVAATAQDLESAIENHKFREDLYFRLNVVSLEIPPLSARGEDISLLVNHFLKKGSERLGREFTCVTPGVLEAFENYNWPGNVRELENYLERMMVLGDSEILNESQLPTVLSARSGKEISSSMTSNGAITLPEEGVVLDDLEKDLIRQALGRTGGRLEPAAQMLGITYKTLQYRIKKYRLKEKPEESSGVSPPSSREARS